MACPQNDIYLALLDVAEEHGDVNTVASGLLDRAAAVITTTNDLTAEFGTAVPQGDDYVIISGGIVKNNPAITVINLDTINSWVIDDVWAVYARNLVALLRQVDEHSMAQDVVEELKDNGFSL